MSRFEKTLTADLLELLRYASRRHTNPFQVTDALLTLLRRGQAPCELGAALISLDATLVAECRDALEGSPSATGRFLLATVPGDTEGARVELAWRSATAALSKLVRLERKPTREQLATLTKLAADQVFVEGAQVALSTAPPEDVEVNRWFFPLLVLDGSDVSIDALLPHVAAARRGNETVTAALRPLETLAGPGLSTVFEPLRPSGGRRRPGREQGGS